MKEYIKTCMAKCPLSTIPCADICGRASRHLERSRGIPFYIPFNQEHIRDYPVMHSSTPLYVNWNAAPDMLEEYLPWNTDSVPWRDAWGLSVPPMQYFGREAMTKPAFVCRETPARHIRTAKSRDVARTWGIEVLVALDRPISIPATHQCGQSLLLQLCKNKNKWTIY